MIKQLLALGLATLAAGAHAQASLDLGNYRLTTELALPFAAASEASAITYNWDTGTLFVVGDEGRAIVEVSRTTGLQISTMSLTGFEDTEGLTYVGNGRFVIADEREQDLFQLTYTAGGTANRNNLPGFSLGANVGNQGIEGVSYDPLTGGFLAVKEKGPQAVWQASIDFTTGTGSYSALFTPNLGVTDLSDIQALSTVFANQPFGSNLLIFSQESRALLEVTRSGQVLSRFDFSNLSGSAEGVTIDSNGVIYVADESPSVFVLTPIAAVPEPGALAMLLAGAGVCGAIARRRRTA
ncbi:SdiA-regulated domain-containing protein [Piscinibacter gummiphilus]|uniref:Ice-binding protein C-terminal domain-containing protein n=1 Tax=Piscinibacter gummiphilus TaxID=946333 RepID=A0A1W6LG85_9BURK|nr:SdiA-regulated domain-containing protein [Piscinibacter gummiphilus]ARN23226.1 hypothetical protein A4W93_26825 [Piscinibacter gummiphilus]ATU67926.1 PEP-CTERM sorting domain-containing protein [Piscinibacter gummiphilus]GLS97215.1 SdiA-regulated [Piscinibacter gummiphilus]